MIDLAGYKILKPLGSGKSCFLARETALGRNIVVKLLGQRDARSMARFKNEARSLADQTDPRIVGIHRFCREPDFHYYTMDFVEGTSLKTWLQEEKPSRERALEFLAEVCEAVDRIHTAGVIHRNLRPSQILVHPSGQPRIVGFGLSRRRFNQSLSTHSGDQEENLYCSPEQLAEPRRPVDQRSDIFVLGILLHEMVTGIHPFGSDRRKLSRAEIPMELRTRSLPVDLDSILHQALAQEPGRRYPRAADLAADLRRYLAQEIVLARPVGRLGRILRTQRKPLLAAAFLVSLAAFTWTQQPAGNRVQADPMQKAFGNHFQDLFVRRIEKPTRADLRKLLTPEFLETRFPQSPLHGGPDAKGPVLLPPTGEDRVYFMGNKVIWWDSKGDLRETVLTELEAHWNPDRPPPWGWGKKDS